MQSSYLNNIIFGKFSTIMFLSFRNMMTAKTFAFRMMKFHMLRTILKQSKILNPIIKFCAINMMNMLTWFKIPSKMFFHDKTMFSNITMCCFMGMIFRKNFYISIIELFTTFPHIVIFSTYTRTFLARPWSNIFIKPKTWMSLLESALTAIFPITSGHKYIINKLIIKSSGSFM